jgi:hypothetical protein
VDLSNVSDEHLAALFAGMSMIAVRDVSASHRQQAQDWLVLAGREIHHRFSRRNQWCEL